MNSTFSASVHLIKVAYGALVHRFTGRTPDRAYQSMIRLFCQSGGTFNDGLSRLISIARPSYALADNHGVLGDLDVRQLDAICDSLNERGYVAFPGILPSALCDELLAFALNTRCLVRPMDDDAPGGEQRIVPKYERANPRAVRYDFDTQLVIDNQFVQKLMSDWSILALAQSYLGCAPILDVMTMWWHTAYADKPDRNAAQYWHFDMDRIKWLKFFVYLTDVGPDNGPHSFIEGSHRSNGIQPSLLAKGYARLSDEEIQANYGPQPIKEFIAPKGTIIAEDTRGLHKGKHVLQGDRLMLQLQFSNSLLGGYYPQTKISRILDAGLAERIRQYPQIYSAYT